jgi:phytoene synthase
MTDAALNREVMAEGSASFRAATRLFDRSLREDVWALYAWCRYCDDQIDGQTLGHGFEALSPEMKQRRLIQLRQQTADAMAGRPITSAPFAALQAVASRHVLSTHGPDTLLDGFEMDVQPRLYQTMDDLMLYCYRVAGVVGVMMAEIMDRRSPDTLRRAQDLGIAFQLTNIARDIREDAKGGRVYLPVELLERYGIEPSPEGVLKADSNGLFLVANHLLELAESYYASARIGLRALPLRASLATAAARGVYREIGRRIQRQGPDALYSRMVTPRPTKLYLAIRGGLLSLLSRFERIGPEPRRPDLWSHI